MASKINFTGVRIIGFAGKPDPKSGNLVVTISMKANWTKDVRKKMGWEELNEIPTSLNSGDLNGKLIGVSMELAPTEQKLYKHRFDCAIRSVATFKAERIKVSENSTAIELSFKVISVADDIEALVGAYLRAVGKDTNGTLKVEFTEQLAFMEAGQSHQEEEIAE